MVNHTAYHLACRSRLLTLSVATTGSVSLEATATGYARTTGSFKDDGFAVGQELTPSGFSMNPVSTITNVTDLTIDVADARSAEVSASGRSLSVLLPASWARENLDFKPVIGTPYVEEQYIPGPMSLDSMGANGNLTAEPMYNVKVYVPSNTGIGGDGGYSDAILTLFCPSTVMTLTNGDQLFVRADVGPFLGQRTQPEVGWSCVPVTIPLRAYVSNAAIV